MRSFIIDEHHLGLEMLATNVVERWPRVGMYVCMYVLSVSKAGYNFVL